uniref:Uncharacterized protein n=1 Tax=Acrobeloides nanus TaxID=290746 RepID=A0A914C3Z7_9BILA
MKNDPELLPNESDLSHEDREGPSDRSPYHEAKQALREMAGDSFEDTDEEFEITQDDEDGQVGVRLLRTSRRPSPNVQSSAKSRTRSRSKRRDETSTYGFWDFYDYIHKRINEYKYALVLSLLIAIILILFIIAISYIFFPSNSTELNLKKYEAFKIQVNERFKTPNQRNLQSIMYYLGRRITGIDKSTDPLFILVAASNEKQLLKFLKDFKDLLNESKEMELLNLTSLSNRLELSANVSRILDEEKGVILHRIDRLTADTPQVLHAMSDSETAPHKSKMSKAIWRMNGDLRNFH